jgi:hypothetical protein
MLPPLRLVRSRPRAALLATGCACLAAAFASLAACLTAPPPDLPALPAHRPTILHDAVVPPTDQVLTQLPADGFIVPVVLEDPNEYFFWNVFVNYPEVPNPAFGGFQPATPETLDGGVFLEPFNAPEVDDPTACNRIEFIVAHQFNRSSPHTPDSTGGDIVTWLYSTAGAAACLETYDAGDGAFIDADAAADGLPVAPQEGGDP